MAALLATLALGGCGGKDEPNTFRSPAVPFTFEYPQALKSCGTFGGETAILGWCASQATFGITATDYVGVGRYDPRSIPLSHVRKALEELVPNNWSTVRLERHSDMTMAVARGQHKAGYPRALYVFPLAGATWRIDCASSPTHLKDSLAACRQAVDSIKPTSSQR